MLLLYLIDIGIFPTKILQMHLIDRLRSAAINAPEIGLTEKYISHQNTVNTFD